MDTAAPTDSNPTETSPEISSGRTPDGLAAAARALGERYTAAVDDMAETAGIVNVAHGRLVDLTVLTMAEGHHVGPGLHTIGQYLCWRLGVARSVADALVCVARRVDDLPVLVAALRAGEISLDQAAVAARHLSPAYDAAGTDLARVATVSQLKAILPHYRDAAGEGDEGGAGDRPERPLGVGLQRGDDGTTALHGRVSSETADVVAQALAAMREDLWRQRKKDAKAAGRDPKSVTSPTSDEALLAMAETALRAGEAAHPQAERYLINYHLHQGADGRLVLTDDTGHPVAEPERRRLLCDCLGEVVLHGADGTPLSVGRKTRVVGRKLRRAILFRHRNRCAVDGCDTTVGLQIHHIWHWEDGGPTDTWNLIPLCSHHHRAHHQGQLHIDGNADLPRGVPGALRIATPDQRPLCDQRPAPRPVPGPEASRTLERIRRELKQRAAQRRHRPIDPAARPWPVASTPTGERFRRRDVHLQPRPATPASPVPMRT